MKKQNSRTFPGPNKIIQGPLTRTFISPKQLESTFYKSFKIDNNIGQLHLFQLVLKRVT